MVEALGPTLPLTPLGGDGLGPSPPRTPSGGDSVAPKPHQTPLAEGAALSPAPRPPSGANRPIAQAISNNIQVASVEFTRPFAYSTASWVQHSDCMLDPARYTRQHSDCMLDPTRYTLQHSACMLDPARYTLQRGECLGL